MINNTYILGLSAYYHDSAAALIKDGEIIAAAEEERFTRKKHEGSFPYQAVLFCLQEANIQLADVKYIIFYEKPFLRFERILETFVSYAPRGLKLFLKAMPLWLKDKIYMKKTIKEELLSILECHEEHFPKILFSQHHFSHAASAFYPSPFEEAGILCVDGVGEWSTTSAWKGTGNNIEPLWDLNFPHSLGLLYSSFTYFAGFKVNSGEYKLMGLAPYGEPKFTKLILDNLLDLKQDGTFRLNMKYFAYPVAEIMIQDSFSKLFGLNPRDPDKEITQVYMDIARSIQDVTEEVMLRLAKTMYNEVNNNNLCLAGGVALNCVANGKILNKLNFKHIWIQPASSDAGGALGAALAGYYSHMKNKRRVHPESDSMRGGYLGPSFNSQEIKKALAQYNPSYIEHTEEELIKVTANKIAEGKVVGWFQGKMEFGPRALGNRSILGDPRKIDMQKVMNLKIKFRESFRPFAPIVIEERLKDYFDIKQKSPYMMLVAQLHSKYCHYNIPKNIKGLSLLNIKRSKLPAITHVDFSARVQTVNEKSNAKVYHLLKEFENISGYPILINTSFNVRGEPIVCTPEEAYLCFIRTGMDMLVINNMIFEKEKQNIDENKFNFKKIELD